MFSKDVRYSVAASVISGESTYKCVSSTSPFKGVIRLNPNDANAYYQRAVAFGNTGDKTKAEQDFAQVGKLVHTNKAKELGYKEKWT